MSEDETYKKLKEGPVDIFISSLEISYEESINDDINPIFNSCHLISRMAEKGYDVVVSSKKIGQKRTIIVEDIKNGHKSTIFEEGVGNKYLR